MNNYLRLEMYFNIEEGTQNYQKIVGGKIKLHPIRISNNITAEGIAQHALASDNINYSSNSYKPRINDVLYFLPGVSIPRVKIKNLALSHNIKTTRDIEKASHIFGHRRTYDKLVKQEYYYTLPVNLFKEYFNLLKKDIETEGTTGIDKKYIEDVDFALEHYDKERILFQWAERRELVNDSLSFLSTAKVNSVPVALHNDKAKVLHKEIKSALYSSRVDILNEDHYDLFDSLSGKTIFYEESLLEHLNGKDAITLEREQFDQLSAMLQSSDEDNHVLAMEIMANCDYRSSLVYLLMVFEKHAHVFEAKRRAKYHVNFKSLLNYLNLSTSYMAIIIDDIMQKLIQKNALTEEWIDIIYKEYTEEIRERESAYFKCHTVTLSEEALKYLNINYKRQAREDFIPEEREEVIEEEEEVPSIMWLN